MKVFEGQKAETTQARRAGYSLVELVGVLAILAVAVGVLTPSIYVLVDRAAKKAEEAALERYAGGLVDYVQNFRALPGESDWAAAIGGRIEEPIHDVLTNRVGNIRAFMIDPNFWVSDAPSFPAEQGTAGWDRPDSPRYMIISSVGADLPVGDYDFDELWITPEGGVISTNAPWDTWKGNWEDIRIERVNLADKFHRVVLNNSGDSDDPGYRLDGQGDDEGAPLPVAGPRVDSYFLDGSVLEFTSAGAPMATEIIRESKSYFYTVDGWSDSLVKESGPSSWVDDFCDDMAHWVNIHGYSANDITVAATADYLEIRAGYCEALAEDLLFVGVDPEDEFEADSGVDEGAEEETGELDLDVDVEYSDDSLTVIAETSDDLEEVVLEFEDGTTQVCRGFEGRSGLCRGTGEHAGKRIKGCWVKKSGESEREEESERNYCKNSRRDRWEEDDEDEEEDRRGPGEDSDPEEEPSYVQDDEVSADFSDDRKTCVARSSRKLRDVVLEFEDGSRQVCAGFSGSSGSCWGTGEHAGKRITGCWVNSGRRTESEGASRDRFCSSSRGSSDYRGRRR